MKLIFTVASMAFLASTTIFADPVIIIQPDYFSGFYIGGNVSVHNLTSNQSTTFLSSNEVTIATIPFFSHQESKTLI